jgi:signal transduction histidine kinase
MRKPALANARSMEAGIREAGPASADDPVQLATGDLPGLAGWPGRGLAWTRLHPAAADRILTAVLAVISVASIWLVRWPGPAGSGRPGVIAVVLALAVVVPLLARRRRPDLVLVASGTALLGYDALNYPSGLVFLGTFWAVYSYGSHRRGDRLWPLAVWIAEILAHLAITGGHDQSQTVVIYLAATAVTWIRGDAIRSGLIRSAREKEARALQAVTDERARIARELHDVVAHALGVIVVQAGGAGAVPGLAEADAKNVLANIERTGRQAFAEMRRLVGVLRADEHQAALAPQPAIAEIPALLTDLAASGLDVTLEVGGSARPVSPGVELAAYRIVQEALTNCLKHAAPTRARVGLAWSAEALAVTVEDDGPGAGGATAVAAARARGTADSGGNGVAGMRERALLFGGDFCAGPRPGGGYRVAARLPLGGLS